MLRPDLAEARRLLDAGVWLVKLKPNSKAPEGLEWNKRRATSIDPNATGYGFPLALNNACSIDPDKWDLAVIGMRACGHDLEQIMRSGVRTKSTRSGSGGRSVFSEEPDLSWLKFSSGPTGTVLECRAASENLQDVVPGLVYTTKDGEVCTQEYANGKRLDDLPSLTDGLLAWWQKCSTDIEFYRKQQEIFFFAIAEHLNKPVAPALAISTGRNGTVLAFPAAGYRGAFNRTHSVASILEVHGYGYDKKTERYFPSTATGEPGVRPIPGRTDLWRSDHASDPLHGTFDAWVAHVVLNHAGRVEDAIKEMDELAADERPEPPDDVYFNDNTPISGSQIVGGASNNVAGSGAFDVSNLSVDKNGKIINSWTNLHIVLSNYDVGHDRFLDVPMIQEAGQWRRFDDTDYVRFALDMESLGFKTPSINMIKDVVRHIMHEKSFDSAIDWLESLSWDGVDRCSRLFSVYFGVEPSPYEQAVSEYFVTAMAGRVLTPGVQADMVPVLLGGQGIGKTSGVKALAPINDSFAEIDLSGRKDSDLARQLRGKLIGELGELRGLKTKDSEWIKAWITRTHEEWTPKFVEHSKNMPRRCVFLGTTNEDEFLIDVTGNRRWLPLRVISSCKPAQIKNDIEQIWAQAAVMYRKNSVMWEVAAGLSESFQEEHTQHDDWAMDSIEEVLNMSQFVAADGFKLKDVTDKLFPNIEVSRASQHRISDALKRLGYTRVTVRKNGKFTKAYKKMDLENPF